MLNQKCKICGTKFHWCVSCDPGFGFEPKSQGYCSKLCKALSFGEDPDEEDLFLAYEVIKELMDENLELQARLSVYEEI